MSDNEIEAIRIRKQVKRLQNKLIRCKRERQIAIEMWADNEFKEYDLGIENERLRAKLKEAGID